MIATNCMQMSLHNRKIKTELLDSNDEGESMSTAKTQYKTRFSKIFSSPPEVINIVSDDGSDDVDYVDENYQPEPLTIDRVLRARQPNIKAEPTHESDERDDGIEFNVNVNVKRLRMPSVHAKAAKPKKNRNFSANKQRCFSVFAPAAKTIDEKRFYCCYVCGKTFPHFYRLKVHMPAHSHVRYAANDIKVHHR